MNIIKPPLLKSGDTIGILAVSGCIDDKENLYRAVKFFEDKGFKVKLSENIFEKYNYLAGDDKIRLKALHNMFLDKSVNAVVALRGGYGALRLINDIDYSIIRENPKIFCGYSDVTVLNAMFLKNAGLSTFSGPMVISDFGCENLTEYTISEFFNTLEKGRFCYDGIFWGGNLSSIVSLCGQDFIPDFKFDFFVEDLNEPVYKIDKMMHQLINIMEFRDNIKSIYLGDFLNIDDKLWFDNLFNDISQKLSVPVIKNFPASHSDRKATIPYGVKY